jgi:hypothetical protein
MAGHRVNSESFWFDMPGNLLGGACLLIEMPWLDVELGALD